MNSSRSVLVLAATVASAAVVHTLQRHRQHRQRLELGMHTAHGRMLEVAVTHPDVDPIWVRNHPAHVKEAESAHLLMCQWWLEFWRTGLNLGLYTPALLRENAKSFMKDPAGLKAWALTRHRRGLPARNRHDSQHVALLNLAYDADGPSQYPDLELGPSSTL